MNKKKLLGQFFTKNSDYILNGLEDYVYNKQIIDIFAGNKDLINWAIKHGATSALGYDVDKKLTDNITIFHQDSLKNPKDTINNAFILTNPPYLNINKANKSYKVLFQKNEGCKDLYHIALKNILTSAMGILILPINFLTSNQSIFIRQLFFEKLEIITCNYFTNQVFNKTKTNIISFYYKQKQQNQKNKQDNNFTLTIYPSKKTLDVTLSKDFNYQLGGKELSIFNNQKIHTKIRYLSASDIKEGNKELNISVGNIKNKKQVYVNEESYNLIKNNIICFCAISSKTNITNHQFLTDIRTKNLDGLIANKNSRNQIQLIFESKLSILDQQQLINLVNQEITRLQNLYDSILFVNYRDNNRKRISFKLINQILNYFLLQIKNKIDTLQ